jgi:hypothetical protein
MDSPPACLRYWRPYSMRAKQAPIRDDVAAMTPTTAPQLKRSGGPAPNGGLAWASRTEATTSRRARTVKRTYKPIGTLRPIRSTAILMIATVAAPHESARIKKPSPASRERGNRPAPVQGTEKVRSFRPADAGIRLRDSHRGRTTGASYRWPPQPHRASTHPELRPPIVGGVELRPLKDSSKADHQRDPRA